jgi:hypothetical protein
VVVVLAAAAVLWWLLDSTVSQDLYDETVAELTASEEALTASEGALTTSEEALTASEGALTTAQDELAELQAEADQMRLALDAEADQVAELEALNEALQSQIAPAQRVARFMAYWSLDWVPEAVAEMQAVGVDTTTADAMLQELGHSETWIEFADGTSWLQVNESVAAIDDEVLTAAWARWVDAEIGSVEEMTAWAEVQHRIAYLMLDALADG